MKISESFHEKMPYSVKQLEDNIQSCIEKIEECKEEVKEIVESHPSLQNVMIYPENHFSKLTTRSKQELDTEVSLWPMVLKMMEALAKSEKEELKRREYQDLLDKKEKIISGKLKRQQKKKKSNKKKANKKMKEITGFIKKEDSSQEVVQEDMTWDESDIGAGTSQQ